MIISILEGVYFVSLDRNTSLFEACNETDYVQRDVHGRGTIILDPDCSFKTANFLVKSHRTREINTTQILLPTIDLDEQIPVNIGTEALKKLKAENKIIKETCIIQNAEALDEIVQSTKNSVQRANQELKLKEIHYDSGSISLLSGLASSLTVFGMGAMIVTTIFYKCNLFGCILRAIIKRSTTAQVEPDGTLTLDLPDTLAPKRRTNNNQNIQKQTHSDHSIYQMDNDLPLHQQLNI